MERKGRTNYLLVTPGLVCGGQFLLRECNFPLAGPGCGLTLPNRRGGWRRAGRATGTLRGAAASQDYLAAQVTLQTVRRGETE